MNRIKLWAIYLLFAGVICNGVGCKEALVYKNEMLGFSLEFPESWRDYYLIHTSDDENCIEVCFIGKSNISKNFDESSGNPKGLPMFYICSEKYIEEDGFIDNLQKIGTSRGVDFYYFTSTDYPIGVLLDVYQSDCQDTDEKNLAYQDFDKAKKMEEDIEFILKTFKSI